MNEAQRHLLRQRLLLGAKPDLRRGEITDATPGAVEIALGGADESVPAELIAGGFVADGDIVDALVAGNAPPLVLAGGGFVKAVSTNTTAADSTTTTIPIDDTIPQNTEGKEFMSVSITPANSANTLRITAVIVLASSVPSWVVAALFKDSGANAIAGNFHYNTVNGGANVLMIQHTQAAGSTSAQTFKVRGGMSSAGTCTFNGGGGARVLGAITKSSIVVEEWT